MPETRLNQILTIEDMLAGHTIQLQTAYKQAPKPKAQENLFLDLT